MCVVSGDPTQDAFAAYFRPEDDTPITTEPAAQRSDAPTGRLFRSSGAPETAAIPALKPDQRSKLRTVQIRTDAPAAAADATVTSSTTPAAPEARMARSERRSTRDRESTAGPGMRPLAVFIVVVGGSLIVGALDVLLGAGLGPIWGMALVLLAGLAGARVRRGDGVYAVTAPAIAALAAVLTVAQFDLGGSAGSLFDRVVVAFFALGDNWLWIAGATALAGLLVAIRSRRR